jgi:hypothetical protein
VSSKEVERWRTLGKRLAEELTERSGYKFTLKVFEEQPFRWACSREKPEYPVKLPDGGELGLMFINAELCHVYFDALRKIRWPDDWIDPHPPFIDNVLFYRNEISVEKYGKMNLDFMCIAYYCTKLYSEWKSMERGDLCKISRFIPAVVKDVSTFFRLTEETCSKHKINKSEFVILSFNRLSYELNFSVEGMNDEEVIENILKRIETLTELDRKFGEWLWSEKRRECYESTMIFPNDPFRWRCHIPSVIDSKSGFSWKNYEGMRYLCKWPFQSMNQEEDRKYERMLKQELWSSESFRYYDFDGNRLRLAKKTKSGLRFLGKVTNRKKGWIKIDKSMVKEEDLDREDVVIAVDEKLEKLPMIPLEKIEFLREDFPELFK